LTKGVLIRVRCPSPTRQESPGLQQTNHLPLNCPHPFHCPLMDVPIL